MEDFLRGCLDSYFYYDMDGIGNKRYGLGWVMLWVGWKICIGVEDIDWGS